MNYKTDCYVKFTSVFLALGLTSMPAWTAESPAWNAPSSRFIYAIIAIILIGSLVALLLIRKTLDQSKWSLSDALSEEVTITAMKAADANGVITPQLDDTNKPIMITELRASTSRMIALMGMMVILIMFVGFGVIALYSFAKTGNMPDSIDKVVSFLMAGLTLFAPYVVNKFTSIFKSLQP